MLSDQQNTFCCWFVCQNIYSGEWISNVFNLLSALNTTLVLRQCCLDFIKIINRTDSNYCRNSTGSFDCISCLIWVYSQLYMKHLYQSEQRKTNCLGFIEVSHHWFFVPERFYPDEKSYSWLTILRNSPAVTFKFVYGQQTSLALVAW